MKTQRYIIFGVLLMALSVSVGCSKKSKSGGGVNAPVTYPGGYYPGGGQPGYGQGLVGIGYDSWTGAEAILEIVAGGEYYSDPYTPTGQAYVYGQLNLPNGLQCAFSGAWVPNEVFQLETVYPGYAQTGYTQNVQMVAHGQSGTRLELQLNWALIQTPYPNYQCPNGYCGLNGALTIHRVNGMACNQIMNLQQQPVYY